ncbi:MmcQ/YjbR family DNA-binding protein [Luteitalea sp.]|uniref:MmcQ/YjbR family DNA-binding protein n=1 Tax=Luteitalea sp. TaxID=2004800 RepID=UPI0037C590D7
MTADDIRAVLLALEGVEEGAHMGHPDFRLGGRVFAGLLADEQVASVNLTPDAQAALVAEASDTFAPAAGAWGRQGWTRITLAGAPVAAVRGALVLAWELARQRPPARAAATRRQPRPSAGRRRLRG